MSTREPLRHEALIEELAGHLAPVKPLPSPAQRAAIWLAAVAFVGLLGAAFADLPAIADRLAAAPDMWIAVAGSTLTAILAALAAFQLSVPDRSRLWVFLPWPAVIVWVAASGWGCLRGWSIPGTHNVHANDERDCLLIIVGLSIPLSALLIVMLRKAYTLHPALTALTAGLAAAAAAATLLNLFHPFDATASDLAVHALAVAGVIVAIRIFGARALSSAKDFSAAV